MRAYLSDWQEVLQELDTRAEGLSGKEAAERLEKYGPNRLAEGKKIPLWRRFLAELADPMILILIAAALISGILAVYAGESFADVIIILAVVLINATLGVVQESKAEQAIEALRRMTAATSKVLRDGELVTVRSEELVPGDVVILEAGDAVPADGRLIEAASLKAEESALTGESVPVSKISETLNLTGQAKAVSLGDRKNMVYMGSSIAYGRGAAVVTETGMETEMGRIAGALAVAEDDETPLQKKLNGLSKILSVVVLVICAVIFAVNLLRAWPAVTGAVVLSTFMTAVSLAVAAIPEGLAAVVTIVLSIGVTNMSRRRAVIRKLTAVETLGCTQVICSDKTGTLTQNRMTVVEHAGEDVNELALAMALCSDARIDAEGRAVGEPTEAALAADAHALGLTDRARTYTRVGEAPFDSLRKRMSVVLRAPDGSLIQYTKGAPDEVLALCETIWTASGEKPMTKAWKTRILAENSGMANRALRVLCAARRSWSEMPDSTEPGDLEQHLCYIGLSGMIDPIRPEVRDAIAECRQAGIRPIMITGDHRDTAVAIARELGILEEGQEAITGSELSGISDEVLRKNIEHYSVYARVQPEHKVRIVEAWKAHGCITAMTGDGVNDAPSIKRADIGVGMGITGTDVTKNVADMVLADDNFATIVSAVEEGRRIYDNIRKSIQFLLSSNLAEVLAIFSATLMGFTVLKPAHLLWVNLITDCFPALSLGMERAEGDTMKRPPRHADEGIFSGGLGIDVAFQGVVITVLTLAAYLIGHRMEAGRFELVTSARGMTMAFLTLSLVEIFHAFNMRSRRGSLFSIPYQNKWLWGSMLLSLALTLVVIYVPFLSRAFGFEVISAAQCAVAVGLALLVIPVMELYKLIWRRLGR